MYCIVDLFKAQPRRLFGLFPRPAACRGLRLHRLRSSCRLSGLCRLCFLCGLRSLCFPCGLRSMCREEYAKPRRSLKQHRGSRAEGISFPPAHQPGNLPARRPQGKIADAAKNLLRLRRRFRPAPSAGPVPGMLRDFLLHLRGFLPDRDHRRLQALSKKPHLKGLLRFTGPPQPQRGIFHAAFPEKIPADHFFVRHQILPASQDVKIRDISFQQTGLLAVRDGKKPFRPMSLKISVQPLHDPPFALFGPKSRRRMQRFQQLSVIGGLTQKYADRNRFKIADG